MKFAVFTVGMPEYSPEEAIRTLKECGYDGVEFRITKLPTDPEVLKKPYSYWENNKCTVDEDHLLEEAPKLKALCEEAGVEICALGTYMRCNEPERVENALKAAVIMGCPKIRVSPYGYDGKENYRDLFDRAVQDYRKLERLAKQYGVKINMEMHMNTITASASAAYRLASHFDPNYIGVIYDTGNIVYEGFENYKAALEILGEYLDHVHIKNAKWNLKEEKDGVKYWAADSTPFKEGHTDFTKVFEALRSVGYNGYLTFEDFSNEQSTEEKLRGNIAYIKGLAETIR
ncbi:MAG: sugar phosphate isomerase/epimerase family protein [Candidatus Merdivicinus sp.]